MALPVGIGSLSSIGGVGGTLFAPGGGLGGTTPTSPTSPAGGKASSHTLLPSPHAGQLSTLTKGDTLARSTNHYGKGSAASPLKQIRGGAGGMKRIRGGLGPGRMGQPGSSKDYSMTSADTE